MTDRPAEPNSFATKLPLTVDRELHEDVVVLRAVGEIDLSTSPLLEEHLSREADDIVASVPLVLDLSGVDFLASTGLGLLSQFSERYTRGGSRLVVVATQRTVIRAIEVTGLDQIITVVGSLDDALRTDGEPFRRGV